jgi:hypothetical protein
MYAAYCSKERRREKSGGREERGKNEVRGMMRGVSVS